MRDATANAAEVQITTPPQRGPGVRRTVGDYMSGNVRSVSLTATMHDAARLLALHDIGCVVVLDGTEPAGIVTERDVVREVADAPGSWTLRPVCAAMTHPLQLVRTWTPIPEAIALLARYRIRRLPVLGADGRLGGIVTQTDLLRAARGDLEEVARELRRLVTTSRQAEGDRADPEMLSFALHDIKNSLHVIEAARALLIEEPLDAPELLPLVGKATARISSLAATLIELGRLEGGTMPLALGSIPWATLSAPVVEGAELLARAKGVRLHVSGSPDEMVCCDRGLIERVLLNLLDNAIAAASEGSPIRIDGDTRPDGSFRVRVINRGTPIPPEVLPRLFEKYRRGPGASDGGWGLGLTFCRAVVERHGGRIAGISPWKDGEGALFEFSLPPLGASAHQDGGSGRDVVE